MVAPGVGIPLSGGFSYREVLFLAEELGASKLLDSAEVVEVNPVLDVRNQTASMAVEIIRRLLGGTIY
jgi:arginase